MKSKRRMFGLLVYGALAVACVPSTVMMVPPPTDTSELVSGGDGVLLLQVADTTPFGSFYPANQVTLAPKDVNEDDTSKFPRLLAVDNIGSSSKLFYAILPANEYSIASLRSYYQFGESWFSQFYPGGIELGTFSVEPDKVTDLGILAVYVRRSGDDYVFETVRTPTRARTLDLFRDGLPLLASKLQNMDEPAGWNADSRENDRENDYRNAVNRQIIFGDPYIDASSGRVSFPSRLGVIVSRDGQGDWTLDAFPDDVELRFLTIIDDRHVVVTEFDEVFTREGIDGEWVQQTAPDGPGHLMYLGAHDSVGMYAVMEEPDGATIWVSSGFGSEWIRQIEIKPPLGFLETLDKALFLSGANEPGTQYVAQGDNLYLALRNDLYRFALKQNTYTELAAPNPQSVQIRNGYITVIAGEDSWTSSKASFDNGDTWQRFAGKMLYLEDLNKEKRAGSTRQRSEPRSARILGHPIFFDGVRGFALHKALKKDTDPFLISTDDKGETWKTNGEAALPDECSRLMLATSKELLLACFLTGEFYRSTDSGMTWVLERAVSDS